MGSASPSPNTARQSVARRVLQGGLGVGVASLGQRDAGASGEVVPGASGEVGDGDQGSQVSAAQSSMVSGMAPIPARAAMEKVSSFST